MTGHRGRLRERYLRGGIQGFDDREVLELLLTFVIPRKDMRKESEDLLKTFGSLKNVLSQPPGSLMKVKGIGDSAAVLLSLVSHIVSRSCKPEIGLTITSPEQVEEYLKRRMGSLRRERFSALLLNSANELIAEVDLEFGTVNRTQVYPRNLVEKVIAHSASGVILVHNHPGGKLEPSREDIALTRKIAMLGREMDFRVLDHFIVTGESVRALGTFS